MRLLLDTDAFCKLAAGGLVGDAIGLLGVEQRHCGRLPALPHMLRKGRLRKSLGPEAADAMMPLAEALPALPPPSDALLDQLTPIEDIDPGEAQIFAAASERGLLVVSGDKRALRALKQIGAFLEPLAGRIVVLEAILLALCDQLGPDVLRRRVQPATRLDTMLQVCFSSGNPDPRDALLSYYRNCLAEMEPLILWDPQQGCG